MTVIKFYSSKDSFRPFAERCQLKDVTTIEKGDIHSKRKKTRYESFQLNIGFSSKDWDDLPGQIRDAKRFLKKHGLWVRRAMKGRKISNAFIDFAVYSRFDGNIVVQCDFFDEELVTLCGRLKLGIMLSNYH